LHPQEKKELLGRPGSGLYFTLYTAPTCAKTNVSLVKLEDFKKLSLVN
jgi:hypothetical protein